MSGDTPEKPNFHWSVAPGISEPDPTIRKPAPPPRLGERLGPYQIVEELGRGGMGVVLRARDLDAGRDVALKVVLHELDDHLRERFTREGEITARLRHPGIVRVHAAGEVEGRPFLAYELLEDARPFDHDWPDQPLEVRVRRVLDATRAIGHAHAEGVVHRDVKPGNILLDGAGHIRVTDFGLASARSLERLTQTGAWIGTPQVMAPEQLRGDNTPAPTVDVWALGVVLYRALTGEPPFPAQTLAELTAQVMTGRPTPPRALAPDVPPALEAVCLRALAREADQRPADAGAFAVELEQALTGEAPRRSLPLGRLVVLALLLLAAVPWLAGRPGDPSEAIARQTEALRQAARQLVKNRGSLAAKRAQVVALEAQITRLQAEDDGPALAVARWEIEAVRGLVDLADGRLEEARRVANTRSRLPLQVLLRGALATEDDLAPSDALEVHDQLRYSIPTARFAELRGWRARALAAASTTLDEAEARRALSDLPQTDRPQTGLRQTSRADRIARARLELRLGRVAATRKTLEGLERPPRDLVADLVWADLPELSASDALARLRADRITPIEILAYPLAKRRALRARHVAATRKRLGLARRRAGSSVLDGLVLARLLFDEPFSADLLDLVVHHYRLHADQGAALALTISKLAPRSYQVHRLLVERLEALPNPVILAKADPIFDRAQRLASTPAERDRIRIARCVAAAERKLDPRCIALANELLPRAEGVLRGRLFRARGEALARKGAHQRALADFDAALPLLPRKYSKICLLRARELVELGRHDEVGQAALPFATSGIRSAKLVDAVRLVWTYARDDAPVAVEHLLRVDPGNPGWWVRAAWLRLLTGKPGVADALRKAAAGLPKLPRHPRARALAPTAGRLAERARTEGPTAIREDLRTLVQALEAIRGRDLGP